ncbi:TetR/AcrR family transcriptional regulator [Streptomyces oryzae]|uniref:TetR/AcrR family transcriptional regulator n=1 Tax=Streptomyces oryzae TaxID=1434886 RepID=A0ABS3XDG6_9ACTN|nr:TetR/AcrR family transcriptional regulator [Streptomyces oryzae]MBO8193443.1 TetR/AcrR family transcriptional regulator [Streptomyces oryzae]
MNPTPAPNTAPNTARNRRADARRSRASILDAAIRLLNERPDAGVGAVATAAGVTRQTVYAHFPSREQLLTAVLDRLTEQTVAAMAAADPDSGPAAEALLRLLDAAEGATRKYPALIRLTGTLPASREEDAERHLPVAELLERVVRRGQASGEFDGRLPADWLVTATIALAHAASGQPEGDRLLRTSVLRLLRAD